MTTTATEKKDLTRIDTAVATDEMSVDDTSNASNVGGAAVDYSVEDVPPLPTAIFLGLQHYLTMMGATVALPFLLCPALCIENNDPARGYIISTIFFTSGIVTLLQTTFGCRLPIVQGGTFTFLAPTFAILTLPEFKCPDDFESSGWGNMTQDDKTEMWQVRIREIQGAICVASVVQVIIGYFGIIGLVLHYVTPLTIAPSIAMIGLSLFENASNLASKHWGISAGTILLMVLCSQYLRDFPVPCVAYKRGHGIRRTKMKILQLFPVLITVLFMWGLCAILTLTDVLEANDEARTDINLDLLKNADWFRVPYPFQWGVPTVSVAGVFGMMAGILASAIESVGDYYACARLSGAPPPPMHAINRGIGTEGIGCIIAGLLGTGNGTTSYSENIGAIGITRVGSRRVVQYGAIIMLVVGLISKLGALFLTIPQPIVGGIFCVMFGIITGVGLSNLQFVDLNSTRNLFIIGFSIFFALVLPKWIEQHPESVNTGSQPVDQIIVVLLSTSMFVGGFIGFFLDNTIPGSLEERGIVAWNAQHEVHSDVDDAAVLDEEAGSEGVKSKPGLEVYDFPFGMGLLKSWSWTRFVPCLPTYRGLKKRRLHPKK